MDPDQIEDTESLTDEEMGQHSSSSTNGRRDNLTPGNIVERTMDLETENFDITLPGTHSYLPGGLVAVRGRTVVEPGWEGKLPCWQHHSIIYPGENMPMLCNSPQDRNAMHTVIHSNKLFGLIWCADEEVTTKTYGVLCEVYEASSGAELENAVGSFTGLSVKAKARQRFRIVRKPPSRPDLPRLVYCNVKILPDITTYDPLLMSGPRSLDKYRDKDNYRTATHIRRTDAAFTTWPLCVYETLNVHKMTETIKDHYKQFGFENFPLDIVSLSFWVASNLPLAYNDQLLLFTVDNAVLRIFMELRHILKFQKESLICCTSCMTVITNRQNIFAMSCEGLHSNYCNPGGFVHDTLTVTDVSNVILQGHPTEEFSWFPGYKWTIAQCGSCGNHLGWRFDAAKRNLRPISFWGLSQHYLTARYMRTSEREDDFP